jgi:hypothetical protein
VNPSYIPSAVSYNCQTLKTRKVMKVTKTQNFTDLEKSTQIHPLEISHIHRKILKTFGFGVKILAPTLYHS